MTYDDPQAIIETPTPETENERTRFDGRETARKTVSTDKLSGLISSGDIAPLAVTQAKLASGAVGQAQFKYEAVTLAFGSGDTSKTASVTSGSIVLGVHASSVTSTPAYGELQLVVSSTTLTGTRSAAPGGAAAITYTVILLKT